MNPTKPPELMFAVRSLFDIGRTDEAKYFLIQLMEAKPSDQLLAQFYSEYGEALFYRLGQDHRMTPEGEQFAQTVLGAAHRSAHDPARIQNLVSELSSTSPARRHQAIDSLRRLEWSAVTPLLHALADPSRADEHPQIRTAITQMGDFLLDPMLGAMETPDEALRKQVIQVLGQFRSTRALVALVGPLADPDSSKELREAVAEAVVAIVGQLPDRQQVTRFLFDRANAYLDGMLPGRLDFEDRVAIWTWDADKKTSVQIRLAARDASLLVASRLARDLYRLEPGNVDYRRLYLVTNLHWAKQSGGLGRPLDLGQGSLGAQLAAVGSEAVEDALTYAMETRRHVAATAAAELLGRLGDPGLLQSSGGRPRPLVLALLHSDRRLRMAAAEAILQIDPQSAYAGSSYVTDALGYFIGTVGTRRALVVHPRLENSQTLVGLLLELGFEADSASTGREAFRLAARHPDYEFALISDAVDRPSAAETIQMFRKDPRTGKLVIGLMGRQDTLQAAESFAETDDLVLAFPQPLDQAGLTFQAGRLLRLAGQDLVTYEERLDQAARAMKHLLRLTEQPTVYDFYDFHRLTAALEAALASAPLAAQAATLLGRLGSPEAQRALVTVASQHGRPLADRRAAADAFADAVQTRGLLLTRDEILLQYERYNRSEFLDTGTQQVLGQILDAIEAPSQAAKTQVEQAEPTATAS
jgi:HEAT repeat protein